MPKLGYIQNGVTKVRNSRRKKVVRRKKRNGISKSSALSFAKKNGLKLVSRTANPKRKKRVHHKKHRNGIAAVSRSKRNGILGNSKHDATQVLALLGGMGATKILGRIVGNFLSPFVSQIGLGNYTELVADLGVALLIVPMVTKKISPSSVVNARLGGLAVVGLEAVDKIGGPSLSFLNPFNSAPIVMGGQPLLTPGTTNQIVAATNASASNKAAVAGAMRALQGGARRMSPMYR